MFRNSVDSDYGRNSFKELQRASYARRVYNKRAAAYPAKVWKHSKGWKESFEITRTTQLDTIFEQSFAPHFGLESISSASFAIDALAKSLILMSRIRF